MQVGFTPRETSTPSPSDLRLRHQRKKLRSQLQRQAAKILPNERVAGCGRKMTGPLVTLCRGKRGPYLTGVQTCGSVWHCPVCAAKISEGRRQEIEGVLKNHQMAGGDQFLVTLTMSHRASDLCAELRRTVSKVWSKLISGAAWKRVKDRYDLYFIRALEVTYGSNGWHPHIHVILCTRKLDLVETKKLHKWIRARWIKIIGEQKEWPNMQDAFLYAVNFKRCDTIGEAGDYIAKWGAANELTKANHKLSKSGGRSPWQLLDSARNGDEKAARKFREYAQAFKGSRQLTWSKGFRDKYEEKPETSDSELAAFDEPFYGDQILATIPKGLWIIIVERNLQNSLILSASQGENWRLSIFLRKYGINLYKIGPV